MTASMIIIARISDPQRFARYAEAVPGIVARYGGRYHVLGGGEIQALEGDWDSRRVVVSDWPSRQAAEAFWNSPEYAEAKGLREGAGEFTVLLVDRAP